MANKKISELPAATTLAGVDEFVVVQGGVSKKVDFTTVLSANWTKYTVTAADLVPLSGGSAAVPTTFTYDIVGTEGATDYQMSMEVPCAGYFVGDQGGGEILTAVDGADYNSADPIATVAAAVAAKWQSDYNGFISAHGTSQDIACSGTPADITATSTSSGTVITWSIPSGPSMATAAPASMIVSGLTVGTMTVTDGTPGGFFTSPLILAALPIGTVVDNFVIRMTESFGPGAAIIGVLGQTNSDAALDSSITMVQGAVPVTIGAIDTSRPDHMLGVYNFDAAQSLEFAVSASDTAPADYTTGSMDIYVKSSVLP